MNLLEFGARAIRVPFVERGRGWAGWDCWGMVATAYREVYDLDIGDFSAEYREGVSFEELARLIEREKPAWTPMPGPVTGDVILYRVGRFPSHVGLVFPIRGRLGILHCERGIGTVLEPLTTQVWAKRLEGYYRHADRRL